MARPALSLVSTAFGVLAGPARSASRSSLGKRTVKAWSSAFMIPIVRCMAAISLVLLPIQSAYADAIPIPACGLASCDLIFNFDFTNPPQSPTPPYVLIGLAVPVNVLKPSASWRVDIFSGLDGLNDSSGPQYGFLGGLGPVAGPTTLSAQYFADTGGSQDGVFSIGLSTGTVGAAELISAPMATAFAGICDPGIPSAPCSSITISGVELAPVPEPPTIVLMFGGLAALSLLRRREHP